MPCHTSSPRRGNTPNLTPFCLAIVLLWLSNVVEQYVIGTLHQHPSPNEPRKKSFVSVSTLRFSGVLACHPAFYAHWLVSEVLVATNAEGMWEYVTTCPNFTQGKPSNCPPAGQLQPLPIPRWTWSHIALDFITGLPDSEVNTVFLMVVDCFSKSVHFSHFGSAVVRLQSVDQWSDWEDQSKPGDRPPLHVQAEHTSWSQLLPWIEYAHNSCLSPLRGSRLLKSVSVINSCCSSQERHLCPLPRLLSANAT